MQRDAEERSDAAGGVASECFQRGEIFRNGFGRSKSVNSGGGDVYGCLGTSGAESPRLHLPWTLGALSVRPVRYCGGWWNWLTSASDHDA